jgi:hypothetical protein
VAGRYISFTQRPGYADYGRIQFTSVTGGDIYSSGNINLIPSDTNKSLSLGNGLVSKITTPGSTKYDNYGNQTPSTLAGSSNQPVLFTSAIPDGGIDGFIFENTSSGSRNLFKVIQNNTTLLTLNPNGNLLIGTTTDAGYKLDVNGTARVQGAFTATLANVSTANVVYYNSSTGLMTYATAPIGAQFVIDYDYNIVGLKNGSNVLFTTSATFIVNTTRVFLNGQRLTRGAGYDYIETGTNQITFTNPPVSTDLIIIEYQI